VPPPTQDDRPALRQRLRSARRALDPSLAARHADACGKALRSSAAWRQSSRVGLYLAHDGEVDARDVIAAAGVDDRALFLPRLVGQQLEFAPWQPEQALQPNRVGIGEPTAPAAPLESLDLLLMPLVAFSDDGVRLGMGGGFYDRSLGTLAAAQRPLLLGLAYELQRLDTLQAQHWDIGLDGVVTECGLRWFASRRADFAL
jgi:5-formyltetrahydrofolate cyclo-ligase